jgi:hypothetical protein
MNEPGKVTTITVSGVQYRITKPGGWSGGLLLFRGGQTFATALVEGFSAKGIDSTVATLFALVKHMTPVDFRWLCEEMAKCTEVGVEDKLEGKGRVTFAPLESRFDEHFRGEYLQLMDWLKGSVEAVFGAFFAEVQGRFTKARAAAAPESASPPPPAPTASGGSGASSPASA